MSEPDIRIVYMGTPEFAVPPLYALAQDGLKPVLAVSQPDKPQGRKQIIVPTPVHQAALELAIPIIQPFKVRTKKFLEQIRAAEPDFIVTAAYGRILTDDVLAAAKIAPVNVHGSLLPKYRGASPVQATLFNGDDVTGVSIPRMTSKMDAGPVYRQEEFPIPAHMRADELMLALAELGAKILPETLRKIAKGSLPAVPQNEENASYVSLLDKNSGIIHWSDCAETIANQVRACYPWPSAFAKFEDKRVKILMASPSQLDADESINAEPGTVVSLANKQIHVQTGAGIVSLLELQFAGGRAMSSTDCAHNFRVGQLFTDGDS